MIYSTYTWDLLPPLKSASPASCKTPASSIDSICPNNHTRGNQRSCKKTNSQQIISYCIDLHTQNPGLREVDFEPSTKWDSDQMNRLKSRRKNTTENKSYHTDWLTNNNPAFRRVELKPSARRSTDRTEFLVNEPLLIVSKLASEIDHQENLMQIDLGRPYQIISNFKEDQPISQNSCSSSYPTKFLKDYQFNQRSWLRLWVGSSHLKIRKSHPPPPPHLLIKNAGPSQHLLLVSILFQWH